MDKDRITGAAKEVGGKVQGAAGNLTGDHKTELEGRFHEASGKGQSTVGQAKDAVRDAAGTASQTAKDAFNNPGASAGQAKDAVRGAAGSAAGAAKDAYDNAGSYAGQAKETVRNAASSAAETAKDAYNNPDRYVGQAKEAVQSAASVATDYAQDAYNNSGQYIRQGSDVVSQQVEENPLVALLIAGAVGYGLALLIHGRG